MADSEPDDDELVMEQLYLGGGEVVLRVVAVNRFYDGIELWNASDGILAFYREEGLTKGDVRRLCDALEIECYGI